MQETSKLRDGSQLEGKASLKRGQFSFSLRIAPDMNMAKIIIIGASAAGHAAALKLREGDPGIQITLITEEPYPAYDRRRLFEFLCQEIKEEELFICDEVFYAQNRIEFLKGKKASSVNTSKRTVSFKDKESLSYDYLVIASGARFVIPEIPGAKKSGVFIFSCLDDIKSFMSNFINDSLCVVGSGRQALKAAEALRKRCRVDITLISDRAFDTSMLPQGVEVIKGLAQEMVGEGMVQAVILKGGRTVAAQAVIFMDAFAGNVDFMKNSNLKLQGDFIPVDADFQTNVKGVYAVGSASRSEKGSAVNKGWDECVNEGAVFADKFLKNIKEEPCPTC